MMEQGESFDDAVVGAGIMGLAHAYALARRGRRVIVFERHAAAQGASVRNFGMIWPIGQPAGVPYDTARRSRDIWLRVLRESGIWHSQTGSLHLAYHPLEEAVLREFITEAPRGGYDCEWQTPAQILARSPVVQPANLRGGMWSPTETCIDPRETVAMLPAWLAREYGVRFEFRPWWRRTGVGRRTACGSARGRISKRSIPKPSRRVDSTG
jgi:D-hydroxyproline dehydrogenase subunit beta